MKGQLESAAISIPSLVKSGQMAEVLITLVHLCHKAKTHQHHQGLLELFALVPPDWLQAVPQAATLYARTLCSARRAKDLLEFTQPKTLVPELQVYRAWALLDQRQYQSVAELPEQLLSQLPPYEQGLFWRFKGETLGHLGKTGWAEAFARAKALLQGEALGRCLLEEGNVFWLQGELGAARGCWSEALAHLRDDPYYIAWVHYNLGIVLQPNQPVQAEPHLLKAEQLSHQKSARKFRSRALCGLGVVRQGLGEWQRALFSYERAILAEGDATDHREALWRKGHLLRMMGQASEALALFQQALDKLPAAWLHADLAAARLMLGDIQGAQRELQQANDLGARGRLLVQVVQAELARQAGQAVWLDSATPGGWLKDEVHCFPRLFAQLKAEGLEVEASLKKGLQVEVRAAGVLQVRVNGREVELPSKPGELLVRLLESEGSEALDFLLDDLYPQYGLDRARRANQALWETADQLRQILGWEDSIQNLGKAYRLDPQTHWEYDIPKLVIPGNHRFLQGVRSRWVRERLVFLRTGVFPD